MNANENTCEICASPVATVIATLLECSATLEEMSVHVGLDAESIKAHLQHVATLPATEDDASDPLKISDARLQVLLQRAQQAFIAAGLQGNSTGQVSALNAQTKLEIEYRRRQELRASRQYGQSLARDPNTWTESERERVRSYLDWLVTQFESYEQKTTPVEKVEASA